MCLLTVRNEAELAESSMPDPVSAETTSRATVVDRMSEPGAFDRVVVTVEHSSGSSPAVVRVDRGTNTETIS